MRPACCFPRNRVFITAVNSASDLNHANIAKIFDGGLLHDRPYMTMEFIDGQSMQAKIEKQGRMPATEAVKVFISGCKALTYAHKGNT